MSDLIRVQSWPFDSADDGYDAKGYPVFDRAVGSSVLRDVFKRIYTDGVFSRTGELNITATGGLGINISKGSWVLDGGIGTIQGDGMNYTLPSPQGNVAYAIMLRLDDNTEYRSNYVRIVAGDADVNPLPPAPESATNVREIRLGYVVVASGATEITDADIHIEKGTSVCPYAAPYEDIDVSDVINDVKAQSSQQYNAFVAYLTANKSFIESAIDDTTAGNIQNQLNTINEQVSGISEVIDNVVSDIQTTTDSGFIEYIDDAPDSEETAGKYLRASNVKALCDDERFDYVFGRKVKKELFNQTQIDGMCGNINASMAYSRIDLVPNLTSTSLNVRGKYMKYAFVDENQSIYIPDNYKFTIKTSSSNTTPSTGAFKIDVTNIDGVTTSISTGTVELGTMGLSSAASGDLYGYVMSFIPSKFANKEIAWQISWMNQTQSSSVFTGTAGWFELFINDEGVASIGRSFIMAMGEYGTTSSYNAPLKISCAVYDDDNNAYFVCGKRMSNSSSASWGYMPIKVTADGVKTFGSVNQIATAYGYEEPWSIDATGNYASFGNLLVDVDNMYIIEASTDFLQANITGIETEFQRYYIGNNREINVTQTAATDDSAQFNVYEDYYVDYTDYGGVNSSGWDKSYQLKIFNPFTTYSYLHTNLSGSRGTVPALLPIDDDSYLWFQNPDSSSVLVFIISKSSGVITPVKGTRFSSAYNYVYDWRLDAIPFEPDSERGYMLPYQDSFKTDENTYVLLFAATASQYLYRWEFTIERN